MQAEAELGISYNQPHCQVTAKSIFSFILASCLLNSFVVGAESAGLKHTPPSAPTVVQASAYIIDILKIVGAEQSFTGDITVMISWKDPRLTHDSDQAQILSLHDIWNPQILIANARSITSTLPERVEVQSDGTVSYRQRLTGIFTSHFDLHRFPNDKQTLVIDFLSRGHTPKEVQFVRNDTWTGQADHLTISDWSVGDVSLIEKPYAIPSLDVSVPGMRLELPVERLVGYYAGTVLASAVIIVCMAWLVFWIPPDAINPRISVSVTSMLTLIAHRFVIQGELPNLPYLTTMDYFLLGSTLMVLLGLIEVVMVFRQINKGNEAKALRLNHFFRWSYPIPFLALLAFVLLR
ncbi:Unannotated [Lentimonas sp. CC4]|nr:Unannotated [Lentimonas sp. CC4]CAA6684885.1 Unannotated [Lentimonas sp. CC6]CAA7076760.1 Unannotated [Lentimonas sp. CC4]CAA7170842.1 Unannotated [Lentimonas sp. CC21]CAA7179595.1 Unannotated [Lentimonas sp. CC8]